MAEKPITLEANEIVNGPRRQSYGHPKKNFGRVAQIWGAILGTEVTPQQVALCMIGFKLSRECNAHSRDNLVDLCGYSETLEMLYDSEEPKEELDYCRHSCGSSTCRLARKKNSNGYFGEYFELPIDAVIPEKS